MPYKVQPGVVGCAIRPAIAARDRSLEEIIYDTTQQALADAGLTIDDIDGIIVGCNDQLDGRAISVMMASGAVGGVDRDILSTPSGSEHAFILGALRVATGQFRTQLVVAWSPTEASSIQEVERLGADPYFHRALPLDELSAHALQAGALGQKMPGVGDVAAAVLAKNRRHGALAYPDPLVPAQPGPARWPLEAGMTTRPITGCVAMVLATEDFIAQRGLTDVAWIRGMGWATEPSFLGDRDLSTAPALAAAALQAYKEAGITDPLTQLDVVEITDATPYAELLAYEALGLCERNEWAAKVAAGTFAIGGQLPVNLSGGVQTFNPVYCTGLIRFAEVANQVRGRAGAHQRKDTRNGLAQAGSGFAMQYQAAIVLDRDKGAVT
ncbi:MAG: acetyl-CoA C-acetyltransferase [Acetobacteraceae bacterium]|jgi:acetyl-CoA C-acetyltransferase|nr:acetyl-CoA C-acetyltransferase [Acetobacteraceae bacterium]MEA2777683.1 acetyl-CoA C-acetyltransferase [Acetobacteraceae bacterium]MEA2791402.1 acetyl-CoA C-acetyltransferase [Acetobacteraceae bacterium]